MIRINRESPEVIAARLQGLIEQSELHKKGDRILNRLAHLDEKIWRRMEHTPPKKKRPRKKAR